MSQRAFKINSTLAKPEMLKIQLVQQLHIKINKITQV